MSPLDARRQLWGNPGIVSLRQFRDNEALIQLGQESPLMSKKGLRYDKISSQNMQCKHEKIRQKSKVKKSAKTIIGARNPRNTYAQSGSRRRWSQSYQTPKDTELCCNSISGSKRPKFGQIFRQTSIKMQRNDCPGTELTFVDEP